MTGLDQETVEGLIPFLVEAGADPNEEIYGWSAVKMCFDDLGCLKALGEKADLRGLFQFILSINHKVWRLNNREGGILAVVGRAE